MTATPPPSRPVRAARGAALAAGVGLLAGAAEVAGFGLSTRLPLDPTAFLQLAAATVLATAAVAAAIAAALAPIHAFAQETWRATAGQLALTAATLAAVHLWPRAVAAWTDERAVLAAVLAALPVALIGVVWYNAAFWLRRAEAGLPVPPWWRVCAATVGLGVAIGLAGLGRRAPADDALPTERSLLLITRRGSTVIENSDQLVMFSDVVAPTHALAPNLATALTGLHPIRTGLLVNGDPLERRFTTVAEHLDALGWRTGAFVHDRSVTAALGFAQGFQSFDDDVSPIPGFFHTRLGAAAHAAGAPTRTSAGARRAALDRWIRAQGDHPWFAWIHLDDDAAPLDATGATVVELTLPDADAAWDARHGHASLRVHDPTLPGRVVAATVRVSDVANTVLGLLRVDPDDSVEGVDLGPWATGARDAAMLSSTYTLDGPPAYGLRTEGVAYVVTANGEEHLFDLRVDPPEDRAATDPDGLAQARGLLAPERAALDARWSAR